MAQTIFLRPPCLLVFVLFGLVKDTAGQKAEVNQASKSSSAYEGNAWGSGLTNGQGL